MTPDWLLNRTSNDPIHASITVDVVAACGGGGPWEGAAYFSRYARPQTSSKYGDGSASDLVVGLGNTLIGDWSIHDPSGRQFEAGRAVAIEMDNQDVPNTGPSSKGVENGASFYRYGGPACEPGQYTGEPAACEDTYTGTDYGSDYVRGSPLFFGAWNGPLPTGDFREPLPSAFAFRWDRTAGNMKLRVWKESADLLPYFGFTYIYSPMAYGYYAFDDDGHVFFQDDTCPVCTCPTAPGEINQLPLAVQEIDIGTLNLPTTYMLTGWIVLAFAGSNTIHFPVPGGYSDPALSTIDAQAWVEAVYTNSTGRTVVVRPAILGNYLCQSHSVTSCPRTGRDRTDPGDADY